MKDNMENFKEISNLVLKDIYVSEELKRRTLEKCSHKKTVKMRPAILSTASAAVLIFAFGFYNHFFNNPISDISSQLSSQIANEYKAPGDTGNSVAPKIIAENKPASEIKNNVNNTSKADTTSDKSAGTENKAKDLKSINNAAVSSETSSENGADDSENTFSASSMQFGISSAIKPLTMSDAGKYFGSSILTPRYVPEGFNLKAISIPDDNLKCVELYYTSKTSWFEILQSKNLTELSGTDIITISNKKAYISHSQDENSITVTTITWISNNIQYSAAGNLPETFLINIAKNLK